MSSLQDKMYNQEVTPPANAWEKIAAALDESHLQNEFPLTLYNTEINPPAGSWQKIIAGLDEQIQNEFPLRLYNMEVAPPAATWDKVVASLNTTTESVSAPVRRLSPILRYAVAAIFIGAVAYGIIKLAVSSDNKENDTLMATAPKDTSITDKNNAPNSGVTQETTSINTPGEDEDEAIEKSKTLIAKLDRPARKLSRAITSSLVTADTDDNVIAEKNLSQSIYAYADHIPDIADRYVMLMTPDGNIIRMSKKWSELLCCVSGEEQDADCKNQLKKWQEKIASSSLAPSPGNFMDILGLVNSLNDSNGL